MPLLTRKLAHSRRHDLMPAGSLPMAHTRHARPLRIALVTEYYYPHLGGICEHVHFFAREARRLGHHVDIITSKLEGATEQPHVIRIGKSQDRKSTRLNSSHRCISYAVSCLRKKNLTV